MGRADAQSEARRDEIGRWFKEQGTADDKKELQKFITNGVDEARAEIASLRREIKDEDYRLLPLSYIANHYFKKSAAWLSQRINGTPVRGKVYTLSSEQKNIFNQAVREIGQKIGSFQLA